MQVLHEVKTESDIWPAYRQTPIELLLKYHNLQFPFQTYAKAQLLIGMCMDNRKHLNIPDNFSFIIRSGGANLRYSEFKVSFAIAVGGVRHVALIGHTNCGMVGLHEHRATFVNGMMEASGWSKGKAEEQFDHFAPMFDIRDAAEFIISEAARLREQYGGLLVAPMMYKVEDNKLYLVGEKG